MFISSFGREMVNTSWSLVRQQSQEQPRECAHVELLLEKFPFGQFNEEHFIPESNKNKQEVSKGFVRLLVCLVLCAVQKQSNTNCKQNKNTVVLFVCLFVFNYVECEPKQKVNQIFVLFCFLLSLLCGCENKLIQIANETKTSIISLFICLFGFCLV